MILFDLTLILQSSIPMEEESSSSPQNRLKFLCSYGGHILPRPSDGILRYVGGEIRVLSVPRSISFEDLKKKIAGMFSAELAIKYQLPEENLQEALISVKTEEDLCYMIDEYDRLERRPQSPTIALPPRFRLFLFPYSSAAEHMKGGDVDLPVPESPVRPTGRMHRVRSTPDLGTRRSLTESPRAYQGSSAALGSWRMGGGGYVGSTSFQAYRRGHVFCSPPATASAGRLALGGWAELSPTWRKSDGFQPPSAAAPFRRVVWE